MTDPKKDPTRRCMPIEEWPEADRLAWDRALRAGDGLFDDAGPAAHWRPKAREKVASSYGRFLTFLALHQLLDPQAGHAERLSIDILKAYVSELDGQVAPKTVAQRLTDLYEAVRVMVPDGSFPYLKKAARRRAALARPTRDKRSKLIHPALLLRFGIRLMAEVETRKRETIHKHDAAKYRNGLMIALLACRAIRRSNFCELEIGRQLLRDDAGYTIKLSEPEHKNGSPFEPHVPAILTPLVERYISLYRRILLGKNASDRLWISDLGRAMAQGSIYDTVRELTLKEFGVALNLHQVRDCHATFMALDDPEHVHAIPRLLGHNDFRTAESYYNLATSVEAAREYQDAMVEVRRELLTEATRRLKPRNGAQ